MDTVLYFYAIHFVFSLCWDRFCYKDLCYGANNCHESSHTFGFPSDLSCAKLPLSCWNLDHEGLRELARSCTLAAVALFWTSFLWRGKLVLQSTWCGRCAPFIWVPEQKRSRLSQRYSIKDCSTHLDAAETQLPCGYQKLNWAEQHLFHGAEQPWRQWINSSQGMFSTHPHLSLLLFSFSHLLFSSYSLDKPNLTSFYNTQLLPGSGLVWLRRQSHCVSVPLNYFGSWRGTGRVLKEKFWKRERVFFPFASWKILLAPRSCF